MDSRTHVAIVKGKFHTMGLLKGMKVIKDQHCNVKQTDNSPVQMVLNL